MKPRSGHDRADRSDAYIESRAQNRKGSVPGRLRSGVGGLFGQLFDPCQHVRSGGADHPLSFATGFGRRYFDTSSPQPEARPFSNSGGGVPSASLGLLRDHRYFALIRCAVFAVLDKTLHTLTPGRNGSIFDVAFGVSRALFSFLVYLAISRERRCRAAPSLARRGLDS